MSDRAQKDERPSRDEFITRKITRAITQHWDAYGKARAASEADPDAAWDEDDIDSEGHRFMRAEELLSTAIEHYGVDLGGAAPDLHNPMYVRPLRALVDDHFAYITYGSAPSSNGVVDLDDMLVVPLDKLGVVRAPGSPAYLYDPVPLASITAAALASRSAAEGIRMALPTRWAEWATGFAKARDFRNVDELVEQAIESYANLVGYPEPPDE